CSPARCCWAWPWSYGENGQRSTTTPLPMSPLAHRKEACRASAWDGGPERHAAIPILPRVIRFSDLSCSAWFAAVLRRDALSRPHAHQNPIVAYEVVPQRSQHVQTDQREQRVGKVAMDVLGGVKDRPIARHMRIDPKQSEVEHTPMPDERDDAEDGDHE